MRLAALFIVGLVGCSGPNAPAPTSALIPISTIPLDAAEDAFVAPVKTARGGACSHGPACADGLVCAGMPGGYCVSACGLAGGACSDGTCVATARGGEQCMQSCRVDADCRVGEGYFCDAQWKACMIPNSAVIVSKQCPAPNGRARDAAFGASTRVSSAATPGLYQRGPSAALGPTGELVVLFGASGGIDGASYIGAKGDRVITPGAGVRSEPRIARDAKGILYAVWREVASSDADAQILIARSRDGGATWSAPNTAHDPADCIGKADCLERPFVVVGPNPEQKGTEIVYVLYGAANGLRVRGSRDEGATFRSAVTAVDGTYGNATVGTDGRLHVISIDGGPTTGGFGSANARIMYAVSSDAGKTFARPFRISQRDEILPWYFANPSIAVDTTRKWIYVAYTRGGRDGVWDFVLAASKDNGKTWKRSRFGDDPACALHMVPNLALDPTTGAMHLAWYDNRGGGRFAHATCTAGLAKCMQTGAINDAAFALTAERDTPKSVGDSAALIVDNKRRMLHAVWTQPVDEGGKIVARIVSASAKLR